MLTEKTGNFEDTYGAIKTRDTLKKAKEWWWIFALFMWEMGKRLQAALLPCISSFIFMAQSFALPRRKGKGLLCCIGLFPDEWMHHLDLMCSKCSYRGNCTVFHVIARNFLWIDIYLLYFVPRTVCIGCAKENLWHENWRILIIQLWLKNVHIFSCSV